jgi:hypothetical protein
MVRAILEGRKTQTRRVVKPQWRRQTVRISKEFDGAICPIVWLDKPVQKGCKTGHVFVPSPYGQPGDRLWVRETFATGYGAVFYKADDDLATCGMVVPWKPSIFMPRELSRITLEIAGVRVERVQDISEKDARAEGCEPMHRDDLGQTFRTYRRGYQSLWDSINAKRGYGWDANPWVWVIEFRRAP